MGQIDYGLERATVIAIRLGGLFTMFVGLVMTTRLLISAGSMMQMMDAIDADLNGSVSGYASVAVFANLAVVAWGIAMIALTRPLARFVAKRS